MMRLRSLSWQMSEKSEPVAYQIKVVLQGISPMIWRRLLVKSDSTIEDLHYIIQIAMGWSDLHLHYFTIHGQQYGVWKPGGINFNPNASVIKLSQCNRPLLRLTVEEGAFKLTLKLSGY